MKDPKPRYRIVFNTDKETHHEIAERLPWGQRSLVLSALARLLLKLIDKSSAHPQAVIGDLLDGKYELRKKKNETS